MFTVFLVALLAGVIAGVVVLYGDLWWNAQAGRYQDDDGPRPPFDWRNQ